MKALQHLNDLALEHDRRKYPNTPDMYRALPKYSDSTANALTKAVIDWIRYNDGQAERIAVSGRQIDTRKTYTNILGRTEQVGSVKWIKGSMQSGTADISATLKGRSVKIEIKCKATGDRYQSEGQKAYQKQIESAGGLYLTVRDFEDFYNWFNYFINSNG
jgi:hypothetical protein